MENKSKDLFSALIFFGSGIGAGILNYLYQVVAARNLSPDTFANLNGWFANLSLFLALGGFLQYVSNFWPANRSAIRIMSLILGFYGLVGLFLWLQDTEALSFTKATLLVVFVSAFGWLAGQAQARMAFLTLALAGFLIAVTKLGVVLLPAGNAAELHVYSLALYFAYLPALLVVCWSLWGAETKPRPQKPSWLAPAALSIATVVFPQYDIVILSHTQADSHFTEAVRATIFSRALYFIIFMFAQWLLPRQIQGRSKSLTTYIPYLLGTAIFVGGVITLLSPALSFWILKWEIAPAWELVFVSSLHMAVMATLFLVLQDYTARGQERRALSILIFLMVEGLLQYILRMPTLPYLIGALACQLGLLGYFWKRDRKI